jgi:hypothetical protein
MIRKAIKQLKKLTITCMSAVNMKEHLAIMQKKGRLAAKIKSAQKANAATMVSARQI